MLTTEKSNRHWKIKSSTFIGSGSLGKSKLIGSLTIDEVKIDRSRLTKAQ